MKLPPLIPLLIAGLTGPAVLPLHGSTWPDLPKDAGTWHDLGVVMPGLQYDAQADAFGRIHILGSNYSVLDGNGAVLFTDSYGDPRQEALDMPPAISVDANGGVHTLIRDGGGWESGHFIRYRYRSPDGVWSDSLVVDTPRRRNYGVGVAGIGNGHAYVITSEGGDNVWGTLHLHEVRNGKATRISSFNGIYRIDNRVEMRVSGDYVYIASGRNDPDGSAFFMRGKIGPTLASEITSSRQTLKPGNGRRGFPALFPHPTGGVDFTMGAQTGRLFYGGTGDGGVVRQGDLTEVFNDLGEWHLSIGIGAAASSMDRRVVVVAGIRANGVTAWGHGALVARVSYDGGTTFGPERILAPRADNGEGRVPVRVVAHGSSFFIHYATPDGIAIWRFDAFPRSNLPRLYQDDNSFVWIVNARGRHRYFLRSTNGTTTWTNAPETGGYESQLLWRIPWQSSNGLFQIVRTN